MTLSFKNSNVSPENAQSKLFSNFSPTQHNHKGNHGSYFYVSNSCLSNRMIDSEARASFFTLSAFRSFTFPRALPFTQICSTVPLGLDTMTLGKNSSSWQNCEEGTVIYNILCKSLPTNPCIGKHICTFLGAKPIYYSMAAYLFTNWHINKSYILQVMKCFRFSLFLMNYLCLFSPV